MVVPVRGSTATTRSAAALACAAAAGLLSSAVSPVVAAGIGTVVLGETLAPTDWLAIGLIVTANAASIVVTPATAPRPEPAG